MRSLSHKSIAGIQPATRKPPIAESRAAATERNATTRWLRHQDEQRSPAASVGIGKLATLTDSSIEQHANPRLVGLRRKRRCDGRTPQCGTCRAKGLECIYYSEAPPLTRYTS
ncbi:hypothetical protein VTK73DRAFT_1210 [Phialemonium thermophilum]|uniref:Zn(2)-C6 fungal-type domain-containing protein n=1 Tax=Phialemonium thermophilum TaxID=223376 RepID=A0ABR3VTP9_9PEZI